MSYDNNVSTKKKIKKIVNGIISMAIVIVISGIVVLNMYATKVNKLKEADIKIETIKLENAIKREASVIKEMENDKALIKYLEGLKASGAAFDNTVYESYDAWIETIKKQIKKSENTLKNIEFKKVELEAIQKYIA